MYEDKQALPELRWFWSITLPCRPASDVPMPESEWGMVIEINNVRVHSSMVSHQFRVRRSVSTIHGHLAVQNRPPRLGNSRFVSLRWGVEGVELELRALRCRRATNARLAGRPRKRRVATQLSAASIREP
jgi:hypothetical protein